MKHYKTIVLLLIQLNPGLICNIEDMNIIISREIIVTTTKPNLLNSYLRIFLLTSR